MGPKLLTTLLNPSHPVTLTICWHKL